MKGIIVFNTAGVSGRDNTEVYINHLDTIFQQDGIEDYRVVVSSCQNSPECIQQLRSRFGGGLDVVLVLDRLPVNVTFNYTCLKMAEKYPGLPFLYVDSGVALNRPDTVRLTFEGHAGYAMTTVLASNDNGMSDWFGIPDRPQNLFPHFGENQRFLVPVGKAFNLHYQVFDWDLVENYGRPIPDVFASYCTESVFSFLCAAIGKRWQVLGFGYVDHTIGVDGRSSGFFPEGRNQPSWQHLFMSRRPMVEILNDPAGTEAGFGYEEVQGIKMHDPSQFKNGICLNDRLMPFLKENLFIPEDMLSYSNIQTVEYIQ